jgi:hypothetical protein
MKRTLEMKIRFTRAELDTLTKKARKTNYSREGFSRAVLNGVEVKEAPSADALLLLRELKRVGYNLDQLLKRANAIGLLDVPQMRKVLETVDTAAKTVISAYGDT